MSTHHVPMHMIPGGQADFAFVVVSPFKALVGGLGSGKSRGAAVSSLIIGSLNAPLPFVFVEPTFSLVKDVALPAFEEILDECDVPYHYHHSDHVLTVGHGADSFPIWFRSGDAPHRIVGFNAGAATIDEPGQMKAEVLKRVVQRCRHPKAKVRQVGLTGTPEGLNWFYDVCEGAPLKGMAVYRARTDDNPYLPPSYVRNMALTMNEQELEAYKNGRFVNLTAGRVYPSFSLELHHRACINPLDGELVVGCDFNVDKMCWIVGRRIGNEIHIFDEVIGHNTNTYRQTEVLVDLLASRWTEAHHQRPIVEHIIRSTRVHTDATGKARKTSANESDLQILMGRGFFVAAAESNPPVKDRVHTVEQQLRVGHGRSTPRLFIDTERCPELKRSLLGQPWTASGPQKLAGRADLSGPVDALGYLLWGYFDLRSTVPTGNRIASQPYG